MLCVLKLTAVYFSTTYIDITKHDGDQKKLGVIIKEEREER